MNEKLEKIFIYKVYKTNYQMSNTLIKVDCIVGQSNIVNELKLCIMCGREINSNIKSHLLKKS